jgi:coiled-coil domain-containing protein 8
VGGWFPWGFLPSPDCLILWSVPDVCKDVDLDVLVEALKPVGTFKKIGKVFRKEEDSTVGLLQICEDVDYLLIPREVRLAGGVWRVISKPATKEAEFRERLTQFLEEEGRTLEDVARIIEKSTPHPPQPPKKSKEPRGRRRVQQMVTPPPRLVVGTYDSSNASDSELSDFGTSKVRRNKGPRQGRKVRKMPVSYLGSKFLGSDLDSEDDEELVQAFLGRGEKKPSAPPPRRRVNLPVPMFEDNLGPQLSKADRWREYVSQVSWGKLKRRVRGWGPRSGTEVDEARQASTTAAMERGGASSMRSGTSPGGIAPDTGPGSRVQSSPRAWRPKIKWASFRRHRKEEVTHSAQVIGIPTEGAESPGVHRAQAPGDQRAETPANERAEAQGDQRVEATANQRAEAPGDQRAEALGNQRAEAIANQRAEAPGDQRAEAPTDQKVETLGDERAEALDDQRAEATANLRAEATANQRIPGVQRAKNLGDQRAEATTNQRAEAPANQRAETPGVQRAEAPAGHRAEVPSDQRIETLGDQRAEATADQRIPGVQRAEAPGGQGAEATANPRAEVPGVPRATGEQGAEAGAQASREAQSTAGSGPPGAASTRARKQVKTVRFQTPGRFSWFRKRQRSFWHTPRLPVLPKRVPRADEARSLRVLRAEAREAEQAEQEDRL